MTALPNILAIDLPGGIEAIVMLVMAVLVAAGNLLKKKKPKPGEELDKGVILPPTGPSTEERPPARPSAPRQPGAVRPQPMSGARARPASTARQQLPQARPTPIARQQLPQARPTPIQQPATRQRVVGERRQPAEPVVLPGSAPPRPQPPLESKPPQRPKSGLRAEREDHRVRAADHAKRLATRAEHTTSRLKEKQMRKAGGLGGLGGLDEHAHGEQQPLRSQANPLRRLLKATGMKQAIILSEIVQPPLALRESSQSLF